MWWLPAISISWPHSQDTNYPLDKINKVHLLLSEENKNTGTCSTPELLLLYAFSIQYYKIGALKRNIFQMERYLKGNKMEF
jgi:hypothetical protein